MSNKLTDKITGSFACTFAVRIDIEDDEVARVVVNSQEFIDPIRLAGVGLGQLMHVAFNRPWPSWETE